VSGWIIRLFRSGQTTAATPAGRLAYLARSAAFAVCFLFFWGTRPRGKNPHIYQVAHLRRLGAPGIGLIPSKARPSARQRVYHSEYWRAGFGNGLWPAFTFACALAGIFQGRAASTGALDGPKAFAVVIANRRPLQKNRVVHCPACSIRAPTLCWPIEPYQPTGPHSWLTTPGAAQPAGQESENLGC